MFLRACVLCVAVASSSYADDFDRAPIHYATAKGDNAVTRLQERLDRGEVKLTFTDEHGWLRSLLKVWNVPEASQVLVFSKTSLQRDRISPKTPRALYFNDHVHVGFCRLGEVVEVAATDPQLGTVFYTLAQEPTAKPKFLRHTENCTICHLSRQSGVPAHLLRSVYTDRDGVPILSGGSHRIDHSSPFKDRWGGWYVTGTHGRMPHLGNMIVHTREVPDDLKNEDGVNVTSLTKKFDVGAYLGSHSDLVALLVFEHQAEMLNRITAANYQTKYAHRDADILNDLDRVPKGRLTEGTTRRVEAAAEQLVSYLLFHEEAPLTDAVRGTSGFAEEFAKRGPFDAQGRSLRQFDLRTRLFRYRCSYLIYSEAFDALPKSVLERIYQRLWDILNHRDESKTYAHLPASEKTAIKEILLATKKGLPAYWK